MTSSPTPAGVASESEWLDNAGWRALTTRQERFAEVAGSARRYPSDVSPFCAVDRLDPDAWHDLARLVGDGGTAVLFRTSIGDPPPGWVTLQRGVGHQMVVSDLRDAAEPAARRLGISDVDEVMELISIARPGPFETRTLELGDYHGVFDDDGRLVAMAGERLDLPGFTEISAVCTHPEARGRGLAAGLTRLVASRILERGDQPFLHVADGNPARAVYERLGFTVRTPVEFVAVQPPSGG